MTETTLGVLVSPHGSAKQGSCGKLVPGMLAKVCIQKLKHSPYRTQIFYNFFLFT